MWAGLVNLLLRTDYGTSDGMSFPTRWEFFLELNELLQGKGLGQCLAQSEHILLRLQQAAGLLFGPAPKISLFKWAALGKS